jgi:hypothetical protein
VSSAAPSAGSLLRATTSASNSAFICRDGGVLLAGGGQLIDELFECVDGRLAAQ